MSSGHGSADGCTCDEQPRADCVCSVHVHRPPEIRAEQERRTSESERAEKSFVDWSTAPPSERPLAAQRLMLAKVLFEMLREHGVSRSRFADMIGVNEKQVRKMLDGRSPVPMAILGAMPVDMAMSFMQRVARGRGVTLSLIGEIDRLSRKELREVRSRVLARLDTLDEERR